MKGHFKGHGDFVEIFTLTKNLAESAPGDLTLFQSIYMYHEKSICFDISKTRAISNHMCRLIMANFMLGQIL
jgi:hypothetical protein